MADAGAETDALRVQVAVLTEQVRVSVRALARWFTGDGQLESERRRTARLQSDVKRLQENFVETVRVDRTRLFAARWQ